MDKDKKKFWKKQQKEQGEHKLLIPQKKKKARSHILLTVAKNRMNEPGGQLLLHFDGAASKFTSIDSRHDNSLPAWVYEADEAEEADEI